MFTLFLVLFVVSVGFGLVIPILPLLARELGAQPFQLGLMTASYAFVQFLFSPMWGRLSDRYGRKPILMLGIVGLSASFLFMGFSSSFAGLLLSRVLGGILASATLPSAQAMAADLSGDEDRGKAMGLMGAAFGTGFIFGPTIGGLLMPLGTSVPFVAGAAMGAVTILLAGFVLTEPAQRGEPGSAHARVPGSVIGSMRRALRSRSAPFYWLAFVIMFAQGSLIATLAYYLTDRLNAGAAVIGLIFTFNGVCGAVIQGTAIGPITRRLGDHRTLVAGLTAGIAGFSLLALVNSLFGAAVAVALTSISLSLTRPTLSSALSKSTDMPQGITLGLQSSFDSLGRVAGPLWAGYSYQLAISAPFVTAAIVFAAVLPALKRNLQRMGLEEQPAES